MRISPRKILVTIALLLAVIVVHDMIRPVDKELTTRALIYAIEQYQHYVSPRIGSVVHCRFQPTCSVYGLEAVRRYGALVGGAKAIGRILRCGPWTPAGTVDEVE